MTLHPFNQHFSYLSPPLQSEFRRIEAEIAEASAHLTKLRRRRRQLINTGITIKRLKRPPTKHHMTLETMIQAATLWAVGVPWTAMPQFLEYSKGGLQKAVTRLLQEIKLHEPRRTRGPQPKVQRISGTPPAAFLRETRSIRRIPNPNRDHGGPGPTS